MRYTVRFAHQQYLELVERILTEQDFRLPEGVYRGIDVVVEASTPRAALKLATERLGWPDKEVFIIPFSVTSEIENEAASEKTRCMYALFELWHDAKLLTDGQAAAVLGFTKGLASPASR